MNIKEKLSAIQAELKAPKNQRNNFGGYNYRSAEDILEAVKPLLKKYKATMTITDAINEVCGRVYVNATATIYDTETDDSVSVSACAREPESKKGMDDSQITGATSSYARKYALNGLYAIDDTKDADATNDGSYTAPKAVVESKKICECCGKEIKSSDPKWPVLRLIAFSRNKYGKELCRDCMKNMEEQKNAE